MLRVKEVTCLGLIERQHRDSDPGLPDVRPGVHFTSLRWKVVNLH